MGNSYNFNSLLVAGALSLSAALPLCATTIFDNTTHDLSTRFNPGTTEVGDEILLAGTARYLTNFSFEFWGTNTANANSFSGTVQALVRIYYNNGPLFNGYREPGELVYSSGLFSVPVTPTGRNTFNFSAGHDGIPSVGLFLSSADITWSVQFTGMAATDSVGVDLYSPPAIGQDYPDYWANNGGWQLLTNTVSMDFAAQFNATANVPEPSVVMMSLVGGLGILAFAYRLRRKE